MGFPEGKTVWTPNLVFVWPEGTCLWLVGGTPPIPGSGPPGPQGKGVQEQNYKSYYAQLGIYPGQGIPGMSKVGSSHAQ